MADLVTFVKFFEGIDFSYEFSVSSQDKSVNKCLLWMHPKNLSWTLQQKKRIYDFISSHPYFGGDKSMLGKIMNFTVESTAHISIDLKTQRIKLYISLYNEPLWSSLKKLQNIAQLLWKTKKYEFEEGATKIDCIWFDISRDSIEIKVYELLSKVPSCYVIPEQVDMQNIKESGFLKTLDWRKKFFLRLKEYISIEKFFTDFSREAVEDLQDTFKFTLKLQNRVKYFCLEGKKKEIYFI